MYIFFLDSRFSLRDFSASRHPAVFFHRRNWTVQKCHELSHSVVNGSRISWAKYENEFLIKLYEFNGTKRRGSAGGLHPRRFRVRGPHFLITRGFNAKTLPRMGQDSNTRGFSAYLRKFYWRFHDKKPREFRLQCEPTAMSFSLLSWIFLCRCLHTNLVSNFLKNQFTRLHFHDFWIQFWTICKFCNKGKTAKIKRLIKLNCTTLHLEISPKYSRY